MKLKRTSCEMDNFMDVKRGKRAKEEDDATAVVSNHPSAQSKSQVHSSSPKKDPDKHAPSSDESVRTTRQSSMTAHNVDGSKDQKGSLPDIMDDWQIIINSMKYEELPIMNKGTLEKANYSASPIDNAKSIKKLGNLKDKKTPEKACDSPLKEILVKAVNKKIGNSCKNEIKVSPLKNETFLSKGVIKKKASIKEDAKPSLKHNEKEENKQVKIEENADSIEISLSSKSLGNNCSKLVNLSNSNIIPNKKTLSPSKFKIRIKRLSSDKELRSDPKLKTVEVNTVTKRDLTRKCKGRFQLNKFKKKFMDFKKSSVSSCRNSLIDNKKITVSSSCNSTKGSLFQKKMRLKRLAMRKKRIKCVKRFKTSPSDKKLELIRERRIKRRKSKESPDGESSMWRRPTRGTMKAFEYSDNLDAKQLISEKLINDSFSDSEEMMKNSNNVKIKNINGFHGFSTEEEKKLVTKIDKIEHTSDEDIEEKTSVKLSSCSVNLIKLEDALCDNDDEVDFLGFGVSEESSKFSKQKSNKNFSSNESLSKLFSPNKPYTESKNFKEIKEKKYHSNIKTNKKSSLHNIFQSVSIKNDTKSSKIISLNNISRTLRSISDGDNSKISKSILSDDNLKTFKPISSDYNSKTLITISADDNLMSSKTILSYENSAKTSKTIQSHNKSRTSETILSDNISMSKESPEKRLSMLPGVVSETVFKPMPLVVKPKFETDLERILYSEDNTQDFYGFVGKYSYLSCHLCTYNFIEPKSLLKHRVYAHQSIYYCPFDSGDCGKFKGSLKLHSHIFACHQSVIQNIKNDFIKDLESNQISEWTDAESKCSICLKVLVEPLCILHELIIHCLWPTGLISLASTSISEHISIYFTGKMVAFSCRCCKENPSSEGITSYTYFLTPNRFISTVSNHLKQHEIKFCMIELWLLFLKLIEEIPADSKRNLNSMWTLEQKTDDICINCSVTYPFEPPTSHKEFRAMCFKCLTNMSGNNRMCITCDEFVPVKVPILNHYLNYHSDKMPSGWCIVCGLWDINLYYHVSSCKENAVNCKFCNDYIKNLNEENLVKHYFLHHSFTCPFPSCNILANGLTKTRCILPKASDLRIHLYAKHFPSTVGFKLEQVATIFEHIMPRKSQDAPTPIVVNDIWHGTNLMKYRFISNALTSEESIVIARTCVLCKCKWQSRIYYLSAPNFSICSECNRAVTQCYNEDVPLFCPIRSCTKKIIKTDSFIEHLSNDHDLKKRGNICTECKTGYASNIQSIFHFLFKHSFPCLFCPYSGTSSSQVLSHRLNVHKVENWSSAFRQLFDKKINRNGHNSSSYIKVFSDKKVIKTQWVKDVIDIESSKVYPEIENVKQVEAPNTCCSSLCTVTMAPSQEPRQYTDSEFLEDTNPFAPLRHMLDTRDYSEDETLFTNLSPEIFLSSTMATDKEISTAASSPVIIDSSHTKTVSDKQDSKGANNVTKNDQSKKAISPFTKPKKIYISDSKSIGNNAVIDVNDMAKNILFDIKNKFHATCIECTTSIDVIYLAKHLNERHRDCIIKCFCGYTGNLNEYLVHTFHYSHSLNESRPIVVEEPSKGDGKKALIVFEINEHNKKASFPCYKCNKIFKLEKSRLLHYNMCKLEKKLVCTECGEKFALQNHLQKHKEWRHNPQSCKYCNKDFNSSSSLSQHITYMHKNQCNILCKTCNNQFKNLSQLKVHQRIHNGNRPHVCPLCSEKYISKNLLKKHSCIKTKAGKMGDISATPNSTGDTQSFLTESDLETELSTDEEDNAINVKPRPHKKSKIAHPSQEIKRNDFRQDEKLPKLKEEVKKVYISAGKKCKMCNEDFKCIDDHILHKYLIHPLAVYNLGIKQCGFCSYYFASSNDIFDHHINKHQRQFVNDEQFDCNCGLIFNESGAYHFHLYYAHKAQRALNIAGNIICRVCSHSPQFDKIVDLIVHLCDHHKMFDHVRYKHQYMCIVCFLTFDSWSVLSLHLFLAHKATKQTNVNYDCPHCVGSSPWHSLEALQYHLDTVHSGKLSNVSKSHDNKMYKPVQAEKESPLKNAGRIEDKRVYCICQSSYDNESDMIGCDNPKCEYQWFHFSCVKIRSAPEGQWYCPKCSLDRPSTSARVVSVPPKMMSYTIASSSDSSSSSSSTSSSSSDSDSESS